MNVASADQHQEHVRVMYTPLYSKTGGMQGYTYFFLFPIQNIDCAYSLVLTCTHNQCFEQRYSKYRIFSTENFHFLQLKNLCILHGRVFVMARNIIKNGLNSAYSSNRKEQAQRSSLGNCVLKIQNEKYPPTVWRPLSYK